MATLELVTMIRCARETLVPRVVCRVSQSQRRNSGVGFGRVARVHAVATTTKNGDPRTFALASPLLCLILVPLRD